MIEEAILGFVFLSFEAMLAKPQMVDNSCPTHAVCGVFAGLITRWRHAVGTCYIGKGVCTVRIGELACQEVELTARNAIEPMVRQMSRAASHCQKKTLFLGPKN